MKVYFASSCLSHLPLGQAVKELAGLGRQAQAAGMLTDWGIQLCPGHKGLTPEGAGAVMQEVEREVRNLRTHHWFAWMASVVPVWQDGGRLLQGGGRTVHPPRGERVSSDWIGQAERLIDAGLIEGVEVMYPGYVLKDELTALGTGLPLAVDVSHVNMWSGRTEGVLRRLERADIREIHVSANDGTADQHRPLKADSFGIRWAVEMASGGVPLVLECGMKAMDPACRIRQVEILVEARK